MNSATRYQCVFFVLTAVALLTIVYVSMWAPLANSQPAFVVRNSPFINPVITANLNILFPINHGISIPKKYALPYDRFGDQVVVNATLNYMPHVRDVNQKTWLLYVAHLHLGHDQKDAFMQTAEKLCKETTTHRKFKVLVLMTKTDPLNSFVRQTILNEYCEGDVNILPEVITDFQEFDCNQEFILLYPYQDMTFNP